jgi:hypothetical protein
MPHKRTGRPPGRPKGAVSVKRKMAHEIIAALEKELGRPCHPLEGLLRIATDETQPVELRANCYRDALPYCAPRLQQQAIEITGANEGPLALATLDLTTLLADPKATEVLLQAAMLMAEHSAPSLEADRRGVFSQPRLLEAGEDSD